MCIRDSRHIVEQNPTAEELRTWIEESGLPSKRFVNTSGLLYKSMNLKDRLPGMSLEMCIRDRPIPTIRPGSL